MITSPYDLIKYSGMVRSVSVLAGHFPFLISGVTKLQIFFFNWGRNCKILLDIWGQSVRTGRKYKLHYKVMVEDA